MKTCRTCDEEKEIKDLVPFTTRKGTKGHRAQCRACEAKRSAAQRSTAHGRAAQQRKELRRKAARSAGETPDRWIYSDSQKSDRKHGRENDLTREFIREQIAKGCSYCGETGIRMTLDRIDNSRGHLQSNVVPACIRCNYTRKNMPYEAWVVVARGMREAREAGLFGGWTGRAR